MKAGVIRFGSRSLAVLMTSVMTSRLPFSIWSRSFCWARTAFFAGVDELAGRVGGRRRRGSGLLGPFLFIGLALGCVRSGPILLANRGLNGFEPGLQAQQQIAALRLAQRPGVLHGRDVALDQGPGRGRIGRLQLARIGQGGLGLGRQFLRLDDLGVAKLVQVAAGEHGGAAQPHGERQGTHQGPGHGLAPLGRRTDGRFFQLV